MKKDCVHKFEQDDFIIRILHRLPLIKPIDVGAPPPPLGKNILITPYYLSAISFFSIISEWLIITLTKNYNSFKTLDSI